MFTDNYSSLNNKKVLPLISYKKQHSFSQEQSFQEVALNNQYYSLIKKINSLENLFNGDTQVNLNGLIDFSFTSQSQAEKEFQIKKNQLIEELIPWRKGYYDLFSTRINSEWDSLIKWNYISQIIEQIIGGIKDKVVCDLGCNNGYFMFKLLSSSPALIVGLDPVFRYYLQYFLLTTFLRPSLSSLAFLLMGYKSLDYFESSFDLVLCLGILYHHPQPIEILKLIKQSLKPQGKIIIDSQGIDREDSFSLIPEKTYTGKKGFWFLPSPQALINWVKRAGFTKVEIIKKTTIQKEEQQKTIHSPFDSLREGMKGKKTIEGYPSPIRIYLVAEK